MRKIVLLLTLFMFQMARGQDSATLRKPDTPAVSRNTDTIKRKVLADSLRTDSLRLPDTSGVRPLKKIAVDSLLVTGNFTTLYGDRVGWLLHHDQRFKPTAPVTRVPQLLRVPPKVEWIFYLFCGILLLLSFLRIAFFKYFLDLFKVFFNTSMRQKQIREQLSQAPLPSLLLNIFFFIIGGIFIYFLLRNYDAMPRAADALVVLSCILALAALYMGKYVFVTMLGWTFDKKVAAENYLFVVFMMNKMAGLFLLPMTLLMAYTDAGGRQVIVTLTVLGLSVLGIIRLFRGYNAISHILRINPLHFIVFVAAFEVIPVLLIYRALLIFI